MSFSGYSSFCFHYWIFNEYLKDCLAHSSCHKYFTRGWKECQSAQKLLKGRMYYVLYYRTEPQVVLRRQKVWVNKSCYSFHFLLKCFKSLLQQDVPALGLLLKTMSAMDCHHSKGTRCFLSFGHEIKQPIIWAAEQGQSMEMQMKTRTSRVEGNAFHFRAV